MILKSLSRKSPSFAQLAGYMSESGYMNSQKADERFEIYRNCFSNRSADIGDEFLENSQFLSRRKNGNFLYHEILSVTIEDGVDRQKAKEALRELALKYVSDRAPNNLTYGALHDDHSGHIHYHLMISANERGSDRRYWISAKKLDTIKRSIEAECLQKYPELKQQLVMGASNAEKKLSRKASELKRQSKKLERHEYVRSNIFQAMAQAQNLEAFFERLKEKDFCYYKRGKHSGVEVRHPDGRIEKYRFATLGIAKEYESYQETLERLAQAENNPEQDSGKEKTKTQARKSDSPTVKKKQREKDMTDTQEKEPKNHVREAARHAAHEVEQVGNIFRDAVTGKEDLGKTLKEQDREDLEDYMKDQQQERWRAEISQKRSQQKKGPDLER